ncbi:glycosyltransferase family 2 protein [candidate division KSB1 bacterium]|nr:glycosyltransferase family 2 protein [candidate division KSB1 bacterium]
MYSFTVICPIRNEEKTIAQCLHSLVTQEFDRKRYEILVVDGRSTDQTRDIVERMIAEYPAVNMRLLDNPNATVPFALNIGLKEAKGEIIVRLDGHAFVESDYLQKCQDTLYETGADCVGGVIESLNDTVVGKSIALAMSSRFGVGNARFRTSGKAGYVDCLAFGAYRRHIFERLGFFDTEYTRCQDDEFNYRLRKYGGKIYFTPEIKSYYYPRSSLKKLAIQYAQYGYFKVRVMQKHLKTMQLRQFIPPIFVTLLLVSAALAPFLFAALALLAGIAGLYFAAVFFFALRIGLKGGIRYFPGTATAFILLHFSYGLGFLVGLIKFHRLWKSPQPQARSIAWSQPRNAGASGSDK